MFASLADIITDVRRATACNATRSIAKAFLSVRPSIRLSVCLSVCLSV